MNRYKGKAARWQPKDKEEQRMNKTEFIKVRCTLEEKQRIKSKAESAGRKFPTTAVRYSLTVKWQLFPR